MKKWLVYVLGIITGVVLTFAFAYCVSVFLKPGDRGLELFEKPGDYMDYKQFEVFQVFKSGGALADADDNFTETVFLMPDENRHFYDNQKIVLRNDQRAQRVGTYRYTNNMGSDKTVPAVKIVRGVKFSESKKSDTNVEDSDLILFDKPGECVSRKNFEVQQVLESGDAIALEIGETISGHVFTTDLMVLVLAKEGDSFYNKQIMKAPKGKCARQIGTYKYGYSTVIPIISFE